MLLSAEPVVRLVCPRCRASLEPDANGWACSFCLREYPVVAGILDLRITADPWLGIAEDRAKALRLEAETAGLGFEETVRAYWQMTPSTPPALAARYIAHVLGAEERAGEWLDSLGTRAEPELPWLDLGCGTGDLASAAPRAATVIGVDIALRWLVVARKRVPPGTQLICADAAHLPFAAGSFGQVCSLGMLEHCREPQRVLAEAWRVLANGGRLALRTTNRYTLLREPHVGVWGVGWVPRRWADRYVRARSGQRYLQHRPVSARELRAGLRQAGFRRAEVRPARPLPSERARLGAAGALPLRGYDLFDRHTFTRRALAVVAPLLEAEAVK